MGSLKHAGLLDHGKPRGLGKSLAYQAYTVWLFNRSDLKTSLYPATTFGIVVALSGPLLTNDAAPDVYRVLARLPLVALATWLRTLVFTLANQRLPGSVIEDAANKPWRPIPAGRISPDGARRLLLYFAIPATLGVCLFAGGTVEFLVWCVLTWMYNDLGGADDNPWVRNLINGFGINSLNAAAAATATTSPSFHFTSPSGESFNVLASHLTPSTYAWLACLALTITATIAVQDLPDMRGDAAKGRRTLPLIHDERLVRFGLAAAVVAASVLVPALFWRVDWVGVALVASVGAVMGARIVGLLGEGGSREVVERRDEGTWKMWCGWLMMLYCLPLWKRYEVGTLVVERLVGTFA